MRPNDVVNSVTPAQDHDPEQSIEGRVVEFCYRIERTTEAGDVLVEGETAQALAGDGYIPSKTAEGTRGDAHGRILWKQQSIASRVIPMWHLGAAAAVTTEASRDLRPPKPVGDGGGTKVRPQPGNGARTDEADQRVKVRPIKGPAWGPDERFREIDAAMSGVAPPLPKGYPGVVLVTTKENKQEELFLPGLGPLVAVDRAGDPALATEVCDLTDEDEIDEDRRARLHTMMRVVRVRKSPIGLSDNNALAWQMKLASQDGYAGGGLIVDKGSVSAPEAPEAPGTQPPGAGAEPDPGQIGAVTWLDNYTPPAPQDGQVGGVTVVGGTRTRPPGGGTTANPPPAGGGTTARPTPNRPPAAGDSVVVAACSSKLSGPLDVGAADDPHRIGTTADGEPINAAHLPTSVLFRAPSGQDAPLEFQLGVPYSNPPGHPMRARVHLRYDPTASHAWVGGSAPGLFRWEAEVPYYYPPPPKPPPKPPPPPPPAGEEFLRHPGGYGQPVPGKPPPPVGPRPEWIIGLEEELGVVPGSIGVSGTTADMSAEEYKAALAAGAIDAEGNVLTSPQPQNKPEPTPSLTEQILTFLRTVRFGGGFTLRAAPWADGSPALTTGGGGQQVPKPTQDDADKGPDVATLVPIAAGDGTANGWRSTVLTTGGKAGPGVIALLPSSTPIKKAAEGTQETPEAGPASIWLPQGQGLFHFGGQFSPKNGKVANAFTVQSSQGSFQIGMTDSDGEPGSGTPALTLGEGGVVVTGAFTATGKGTFLGRLDPTTVEFIDTTTDNIPNGKAGLRFNSASNVRPIWKQPGSPYTQGPLALLSDVTGAWELVEAKTVTANSTTLTFSGLDGDTDSAYMLVWSIINNAGANVFYSVQPNGVTSNQGGTFSNWTTTFNSSTTSALTVGNGLDGGNSYGVAYFYASKSIDSIARKRGTWSQGTYTSAAAAASGTFVSSGIWNESSTNVTSIEFESDSANGIGDGSRVCLYKLVTA